MPQTGRSLSLLLSEITTALCPQLLTPAFVHLSPTQYLRNEMSAGGTRSGAAQPGRRVPGRSPSPPWAGSTDTTRPPFADKLLEAWRGRVGCLGSRRSQRVTAHSLRRGAKGWGSPGAGGDNCVPQRDLPSTVWPNFLNIMTRARSQRAGLDPAPIRKPPGRARPQGFCPQAGEGQ